MTVNDKIIKSIKEFQNAAGVKGKEHKADKKLDLLVSFLKPDDITKIQIAMGHHDIGEGREELDDVCVAIRKRLGDTSL